MSNRSQLETIGANVMAEVFENNGFPWGVVLTPQDMNIISPTAHLSLPHGVVVADGIGFVPTISSQLSLIKLQEIGLEPLSAIPIVTFDLESNRDMLIEQLRNPQTWGVNAKPFAIGAGTKFLVKPFNL